MDKDISKDISILQSRLIYFSTRSTTYKKPSQKEEKH